MWSIRASLSTLERPTTHPLVCSRFHGQACITWHLPCSATQAHQAHRCPSVPVSGGMVWLQQHLGRCMIKTRRTRPQRSYSRSSESATVLPSVSTLAAGSVMIRIITTHSVDFCCMLQSEADKHTYTDFKSYISDELSQMQCIQLFDRINKPRHTHTLRVYYFYGESPQI